MTPERHQKLEELFHAVLEIEPGQRAAFVEQMCGDDDALRTELQSLLRSHKEAGQFIEMPALELAARQLTESATLITPGTQIGHYEILSLLGAGGMGEVYLAVDTRLGRKAALKILPPDVAADPNLMKRFTREAQTASHLNHPSIATIYDVGEAGGIRFIAMEYVEGTTLSAKIASREMSLATILNAAIQIAEGLEAAHSQGITHRDVKPDNIMVRPDGRIKILDFGLAKLTPPGLLGGSSNAPTIVGTTMTQAGLVMGTVRYMSPEQARGDKLDARTDIFSIGVVLYEMLSGSPPFSGRTASDVLASLLVQETPPLPRSDPNIPADLERIVMKALRKDREERYQTIKDLIIDLKNVQPGTAAVSKAIPRAGRIGRLLPIGVIFLIAIVPFLYLIVSTYSRGQATDSLAVLPFTNASANADTEYLSDGLSDSLINNLSQVSNLRVVSLSSVLRFKGQQTEAQDIGRLLNVRAVVMGRLVQRGDTLLVSAELVDTRDNRRIWGQQYNRKLSDILEIQLEISQEISEQLRLKLSGTERQLLTRSSTKNADAYRAYLEGHYFWSKFTVDGVRKSIPFYEQAIEKDPGYALAYSGLADSYVVLGLSAAPPKEVFPKAKAAAMKAMQLDESLGAAHIWLGAYKLFYEWDWPGAELEARRAKELNPSYNKAIELNTNYGEANHYYCQYLDVMGRSDEAIGEMTRALQFDPLAYVMYGEMGYSYYVARQYSKAIEATTKALDKDPNLAVALQARGNTFEQLGRYDDAIAELIKAKSISNDDPWIVADLGNAYALAGKRTEALTKLRELQDRSKREYITPYFLALVYVGLGDKEQALQWLQKAYEERSPLMTWLKVEPKLDSLRSDPGFMELVRLVGFAP